MMDDPTSMPFRAVVESANDAIIITGPDLDYPGPTILYVNRAFTELTGFTAEEAIGKSPRMFQGPRITSGAGFEAGEALRRGEAVHTNALNYGKDGRQYWVDIKIIPLRDEDGNITHFAAIERDITKTKEQQDQLRRLAEQDELTGLANRRHFLSAMRTEIGRAVRYRHSLSVLMLDIDHFKRVNDSRGHAAGDQVLRALAETCVASLREMDLVGRIGGEEFAVMLPETGANAARDTGERLREAVGKMEVHVKSDRRPIHITCSIGATALEHEGDTVDRIMARADRALYRAKDEGRNRLCAA